MSDIAERIRFEPAEVEPRTFARWEAAGIFHPDPEEDEPGYSIAVPPPNVTGALHMGHALNGSIQDTLIRLHRMRGERTKWIYGTDHAGIATQTQVEKLLRSEGTSREAIGREAFVARVWEWRAQYGSTIVEQFKRLGASLDYADERFTLDRAYARAVLEVFVALYEKGLIYRDNRMVNWDPGSRSAISDLEVDDVTVTDTLYSVDYPLASGNGSLTVATVRPETMLADTAIAVHPDDDRYSRLVGETAILPLVGRRLKIIADPYVKPEFGTGALKITPGHDPNDFEIGRRHRLEELSVIGEDGRMSEAAGPDYAGLTVLECRDRVVAALREEGRLSGARPYEHAVPVSNRSGERIEPLVSLQWFMAMDELARPAIEAVRDGRVRIHPASESRRYVEWLENIRPWCISRQLWWGHQIPVWYRGETGEERHVGLRPPEGEGWSQDPDVLDTWFSSALWPFATLGWPRDNPQLRAFHPTDVLSTARDILFLWVARMVMMGLEFTGEAPFSDVYVHSVIQAPDGRRMSKSLGTGIDPLDLIDRFGADATRFGLLAMASDQDVRFSEERIAQGQQLATKLWNASRLVLTRVPGDARLPDAAPRGDAPEDAWILARLDAAVADVGGAIDAFDFHRAVLRLYDFVYSELCDWYLELVKPRLYEEDPEAAATALWVLAETLALAHPVMPFITEELWDLLPGAEGLLATHRFPVSAGIAPVREVDDAIAAVTALRGWRDSVGARPSAVLDARLDAPGYERTRAHVARLARVTLDAAGEAVATVPVPGGAVAVLASEAVDLEAEARRGAERRARLDAEIARAEGKLANERFVAKAPPDVVQAERDKLAALRTERAELE